MAPIDNHVRDQLAELASELLRLQEENNTQPRRTGAFSPETLRRWTEVSHGPQIKSKDLGSTQLDCQDTCLNTHEGFRQTENDESITVPCAKYVALEEKLRQSEQRAKVLEERLVIVKESGDAVIRSRNEELEDMAQDRARSETAMIKELSTLDSQRRAERDEYEARIQEWIKHDESRKVEVEEYEKRIESLLGTVRMMGADAKFCQPNSSSRDTEAEHSAKQDVYNDLTEYIDLLASSCKSKSINDAFNLFNADPRRADKMVAYYSARPELKEFTLKSELPRMSYEILAVDETTGNNVKLLHTDEIRSLFSSLNENPKDEELEILIRAANQSLLADPLAILTGEGDDRIVHSGSFHSTVVATACFFKLDLRRKGERRIKVLCELAVCIPSGLESNHVTEPVDSKTKDEKLNVSATLELAQAQLLIQFAPSPTATASGPLVNYHLVDIKPTIDAQDQALLSAASALGRDWHNSIQSGKDDSCVHLHIPNVKSRFLSRVKQFSFSSNHSRTSPE